MSNRDQFNAELLKASAALLNSGGEGSLQTIDALDDCLAFLYYAVEYAEEDASLSGASKPDMSLVRKELERVIAWMQLHAKPPKH